MTPSGGIISESGRHYTVKDYKIRLTTREDEKAYQASAEKVRERQNQLEQDQKQRASLSAEFDFPVNISSLDGEKRTIELTLTDADILILARLLKDASFRRGHR